MYLKKVIAFILVTSTFMFAQEYKSTSIYVADSKNIACQKAIQLAKEDALGQAGTFIVSDFTKKTTINNDQYSSIKNKEFQALTLGTVKIISKKEHVKTTQNYQFKCTINGIFEINTEEMQNAYEKYLQKSKENSNYFEATGYSEEGQGKFRAFKAAEIDAKRNLLEIIKGSDIFAKTIIEDGNLEKDIVINTLNGHLRYIQIVSKNYDSQTKSAEVKVKLTLKDLKKQIN